MNKLLAYTLTGYDNGAEYFLNAPDEYFCSGCGSVVKDGYYPKSLAHLKKRVGDISSTYDGKDIVSEKFKNFCEDNAKIDGLSFKLIHPVRKLFLLEINKKLKFDFDKRKTRFEEYCKSCHSYSMVTGADPAYLKELDFPIKYGIFRTDILFGSYKEKAYQILIGIETKEEMVEYGLKGMCFGVAYG